MRNENKHVYITRQRERYKEFQTRNGKSLLITEVMLFLQISRDHTIRILNNKSANRQAHSGPQIRRKLNYIYKQSGMSATRKPRSSWYKAVVPIKPKTGM